MKTLQLHKPAFPTQHGSEKGMTLRDYFAAKALQALIQREAECGLDDVAGRSALAYEYADAMLEEREQ